MDVFLGATTFIYIAGGLNIQMRFGEAFLERTFGQVILGNHEKLLLCYFDLMEL